MGWFSTSKAPDHTTTVITREDRQQCWDSRDAYFSCLDNAGVLKPGEEGKACQSQKTGYEQNCAKSWVRHDHLFLGLELSIVVDSRLNTLTNGVFLRSARSICWPR